MKYALIHRVDNNRVVQVSDETFPVHEDLVWVECDDDVTSRYKYVDESFVAPVDRPVYQREREAEYPPLAEQLDYIYHNGVDAWKTDMIDPIKQKYPKPE